MVGKNGQVENQDKQNDGSNHSKILVDTKDHNAQSGQDVFQDEEVHVPIAHEEVHERVDFPSPFVDMKDREVGVQNGEQHDEEKEDKKVMAIDVDIQMGLSICPSPNGSTAPREDVPAKGRGGFLPSIRYASPVRFELNHPVTSDETLQEQCQGAKLLNDDPRFPAAQAWIWPNLSRSQSPHVVTFGRLGIWAFSFACGLSISDGIMA
jgi:hypothetical protein